MMTTEMEVIKSSVTNRVTEDVYRGEISNVGIYEAQETLLERLERKTMPASEFEEIVTGMRNILFILIGLGFLKEPLFRVLRGSSPINLELLKWSFMGFGTTAGLFLMISLSSLPSYLLHYVCVKGWITEPTREAFHRVAEFLHIMLSGKLIRSSELSLIPSFALSCQTMSVFMKMHSYFLETRKALEQEATKTDGNLEQWVRFDKFLYFVVAPTLVYKPEGYRKIDAFRLGFFVRKLFALIGLLVTLYLIATESIVPMLSRVNEMRMYEFLYNLILPCSTFFITSFLVLFEAVLNLLAEITLFADRRFYEDWWNSSSLNEFSRRWNRPVHEWLERHIYRAAIKEGFPKLMAVSMTFLFSALFHEWVLALTFRRSRIYMFLLMMSQVPLIVLPRRRLKSMVWKDVANVCLWFSFFIGLGLLCALYAREWYINTKLNM